MSKKIVIFDAEYTSWENCQKLGWDKDKNQYKEVIQISGLKIDVESQEIIDQINIFIKPTINPELSEYIQKLTNITQSDINEKAELFDNSITKFITWKGSDTAFSYGNDISVIINNSKLINSNIHSLINLNEFKDIRKIFSDHGIPVKKYSSGELYNHFNLNLSGHTHDALFDSISLFESLKQLSSEQNKPISSILKKRTPNKKFTA